MTNGERIGAYWQVPGGDMVVGMAQSGRNESDAQFVLARIVDLKVDDLVFSGSLSDNGTSASHKHPNVFAGTGGRGGPRSVPGRGSTTSLCGQVIAQ
jgi:hypothetical protein